MATSTIQKMMNESKANYCKMPDGTLMVWGFTALNVTLAANAAGEATVTLPISFVDSNFLVIVTASYTSIPSQRAAIIKIRTPSTFTVNLQNTYGLDWTPTIAWFAIGRWK